MSTCRAVCHARGRGGTPPPPPGGGGGEEAGPYHRASDVALGVG